MSDRLFKRGATWYCWVYGADGQRIQKSTRCRDRKAAEAVARELERRAADPAYAASNQTTLEDALRNLIRDRTLKNRAQGTLSMIRLKGGHLTRILGASLPLAQVDAKAVDAFVDRRIEEGAARNTIHKELSTLRGALKVAKRRGEYTRDIAAVMPDGFATEYRPRERFLTVSEAQGLLAELTADRAARVAFILATSARWSESELAQLADVDLARGVVLLRGTKTEASRRAVPIIGWAQKLLEHAIRYAEGQGGRLFRPWGNVRRDLHEACERAAIAPVSPNDLRRTCATWLRQGGVEPHLIAAMLGHTDTRMVERIYGRMPVDSLGKALRLRLGEPETGADDCSECVAAGADSEGSEGPRRQPEAPFSAGFVVPRDGIEPPTRGFSIRCSTN
jgi:integrase